MLTQQVRCRWQQGLQQSQPGSQGLSWRLMQSFLLKQRALGPPCYPVLPQGTAIRLRTFESMLGKGMHNVPPVNALDLCCKVCTTGAWGEEKSEWNCLVVMIIILPSRLNIMKGKGTHPDICHRVLE